MPKHNYSNPERWVYLLHEGKLDTQNYGKNSKSMKEELAKLKDTHVGAEIATPVVYSDVTAEKLNPYDRLARFILTIAYSYKYKDEMGFVRPQLIGIPTIAIACHGGKIYAAANMIKLGEALILLKEALHKEEVDDELVPVKGGSQKHAEMQIVDHFSKEGWRLDDDMIGVSKPCCIDCAERLDALGITYSYWHDQGTGDKWQPPAAEKAWW